MLAPEVGLTTKHPRKGRQQEDLDAGIVDFYRSDPISRATPGKKDSRSFKLPYGSREHRQIPYMAMSIGEAFKEEEVGVELRKSMIFSLRPPEILHEKEIPAMMKSTVVSFTTCPTPV